PNAAADPPARHEGKERTGQTARLTKPNTKSRTRLPFLFTPTPPAKGPFLWTGRSAIFSQRAEFRDPIDLAPSASVPQRGEGDHGKRDRRATSSSPNRSPMTRWSIGSA